MAVILLLAASASAEDISTCRNLNVSGTTYILTANVSNAGTCFTVLANNVTLDCQGHKINYSQSAVGYAVRASGYVGSTVKDCRIYQGGTSLSAYGIYLLSGVTGGTIQNNTIRTRGNSSHGVLVDTSSNTSRLINNKITLIGKEAYGIYVWGSSKCNLSENNITTSGETGRGIYLNSNSNSNRVVNNTITTSGQWGYGVDIRTTSNHNTVQDNAIRTSGQYADGIGIQSAGNNSLSGNNINTNNSPNSFGIYLSSSSDNNLTSNNISTSGTTGYGIAFWSNCLRNNLFSNIISTKNTNGYGISLQSNCNYNNLVGNNISTNGTTAFGVYLNMNSTYNNLSSNRIFAIGSTSFGIFLEASAYNTIYSNLISPNCSDGNGIILRSDSSYNNVTSNNITTDGLSSLGIYVYNLSDHNSVSDNIISTSGSYGYGIILASNSSYNLLSSNIISTKNTRGYGIYLSSSSINTLSSNNVSTSGLLAPGIYVDSGSDYNNLTRNIVSTSGETGHGILIAASSSDNNISSNSIYTFGFTSRGIYQESSSRNTLSSNNISTNGTNGHGIHLSLSSNTTVSSNIISTNGSWSYGIEFAPNSSYNNITTNLISTSGEYGYGILLYDSSDYNNLSSNNISTLGEYGYGVRLESSSNYNNFYDNTISTSGDYAYGIIPISSVNFTVSSNNITTAGLNAHGFYSYSSPNNTVSNNEIRTSGNNSRGIWVYYYSGSSTVSGNTINSKGNGIIFESSNISRIQANTVDAKTQGIVIAFAKYANVIDNNVTTSVTKDSYAINFHTSSSSNVTGNRVNTSCLFCIGILINNVSNSNKISDNILNIIGDSSAGIQIQHESISNIVENNTIRTNNTGSNGIWLYNASNSSVTKNIIQTSGTSAYGIRIARVSENNTITNSTIKSTQTYGIYLEHSGSYIPSRNVIYNNLINGSIAPIGFSATTAANTWNTTQKIGNRTYSNGNQIGGNYYTNSSGTGFSDTCADADNDGFCDSYYNVSGNKAATSSGINIDYLPLSDEYFGCSDGTYHWNTAEECGINSSRVCRNATIMADCNVVVNNSATLTFNNVSFWMNSSAGYTVFNVTKGSSFIAFNNSVLDETSIRIYGFGNLTNVTLGAWDTGVVAYNASNVFLANIPYQVWTSLSIQTNSNVTMSNSHIHAMNINFGGIPAGHNATLNGFRWSRLTPGTVFSTSYGPGKVTAIGDSVTFGPATLSFGVANGSYNIQNSCGEFYWYFGGVGATAIINNSCTLGGTFYLQDSLSMRVINTTFTAFYDFFNSGVSTFEKPASKIAGGYTMRGNLVINGYLNLTGPIGKFPGYSVTRYYPFRCKDNEGLLLDGCNVTIKTAGEAYESSCITGADGLCNASVFFNYTTVNETDTFKVYANNTFQYNLSFAYDTSSDLNVTVNTLDCGNLSTANTVYTLTQNVSSAGTCFKILANNVTLDCMGHTINYSRTSRGYAINNSGGYDYTKIKNCKIYEGGASISSYAVYFSGVTSGLIENNTISTKRTASAAVVLSPFSHSTTVKDNMLNVSGDGTNYVINIGASNYVNIINNTINAGLTPWGIYLTASSYANITRNRINTPGEYAIYITYSSTTAYYNHTIDTSNTERGKPIYYYFDLHSTVIKDLDNVGQLYVAASNNVTIRNVTVDYDGITLAKTENSTVYANIINASGPYIAGIIIFTPSKLNTIRDNTIIVNSAQGIWLYQSTKANITGNTISVSGVGGNGIYFFYANYNNITDNSIYGGGSNSHGIQFDYSSNNRLISNNITSTGGSGYYSVYLNYDSDNNLIANSSIKSTQTYAIYIRNSTTDKPENNRIYNCLLNGSVRAVSGTAGWGNILNYWNTTLKTGARRYSSGNMIGGNYYTNKSGQGYSDTCTDANHDGFCDSHYNVSANAATAGSGPNVDYLPLSDEYYPTVFFVNLTFPSNKTITVDTTPNFVFKVMGTESTYNCTLYLNGTSRGNNASVQNNTATTITSSALAAGTYNWFVNCTALGVTNKSTTRTIDVGAALTRCGILVSANTQYNLTQNVSSAGTCFTIAASNVTLDGKGHKLTYSQTTAGYGVVDSGGYDYAKVRNLIITKGAAWVDYSQGVYFVSVDTGFIENNTIRTNDDSYNQGIYLSGCSKNKVINNRIQTYGYGGDGILLESSSDCNITQNSVAVSNIFKGEGIYLTYSSLRNKISWNNITMNYEGSGVTLYGGPAYNNITNNIIHSNYSAALYFWRRAYNNIVTNCTLISAGGRGISMEPEYSGAGYQQNDNVIYNNLINGSSKPVYISTLVKLNRWNTTKKMGVREYSSGNYIGGNYYTNKSGQGYSDTCTDADYNGFCDSSYNVTTNTACSGSGCGNNTDYLPLSDEYFSCSDGTYYWSSKEDCVINYSRVCRDATIIAACDVVVNDSGSLTFDDVSFYMNSSYAGEYDFAVQSTGRLATDNTTTFDDYGGTGRDFSLVIQGNASLRNTTIYTNCVVSISGYANVSMNYVNKDLRTFTAPFLSGRSKTNVSNSQLSYPYFICNQANHNCTIKNIRGDEVLFTGNVTSTAGFQVYFTNSKTYTPTISLQVAGTNTVNNTRVTYLQLRSNSVNRIENTIISSTAYFESTSRNILKNTTTNMYYVAGSQSNVSCVKPYSSFTSWDGIDISSAASGAVLEGYALLPASVDSWQAASKLNRYYPIFVYLQGTSTPMANMNVTVRKSSGAYVNSKTTDLNGYANLNITFNSTNYGAGNFTIYLNGTSKGDISFLNDTHPDGMILYYDPTYIHSCMNLMAANTVYRLTANVTSAGTCFNIRANNITLDCRGYKINYSQSVVGYAVNDSGGYDDLTVRNCKIYQGSTTMLAIGVYLSGVNGASIDNNTIRTYGGHGYGAYLTLSDYNTISNNTIITAANSYGYGLYLLVSADSNQIIDNTINVINAAGIHMRASTNNTLRDNILTSSGGYAIELYQSTTKADYNHTIDVSNTEHGEPIYYLFNNDSVTIEDIDDIGELIIAASNNVTVRNLTLDQDGILLYSTENSTIEDCSITSTDGWSNGVYLASSYLNTLRNNSIFTAARVFTGISLDYSNLNAIENNSITILADNSNGIYFWQSSNNNVTENTITASDYAGIGVSIFFNSDNNTITENSIQSRSSYAIYFRNDTTSKPENNIIYNNLLNGSSSLVGVYGTRTSANTWNTTKKTGTRTYSAGNQIGGNYYTNSSGTGYSDTCTDADHNGFCDTAYTLLTSNVDYLPLSDEYSITTFSVSLIAPADPTTTDDNTPDVSFEVTGSEGAYNCSVYFNETERGNNATTQNDTPTTLTVTALADGPYLWYVNCSAIGETQRSLSRNLEVDTENPQVTISQPAAATNLDDNVTLQTTITDANLDECWYSLDDWATNTTYDCSSTTFIASEGANTVRVAANDTLGHVNDSASITFTVDSLAPSIVINSPLNATYASTNITLDTTITDPNRDTCWYSLDSWASNISYNCSLTYVTASVGANTVRVAANDTLGHINSSEFVSFTVDLTASAVTLLAPLNGSLDLDGDVTFSYLVVDNSSPVLNCTLYSDTSGGWSADASQLTANGATDEFNLTGIGDGTFVWNVLCTDGANSRFADQNYTFTVDASTPDLMLSASDVVLSDSTPTTGSLVTIGVTAHNLGGAASGNFEVGFLLDGAYQSNNTLSVGAYSTNTTVFSWAAVAGVHTILIALDYSGGVAEVSELNNNASVYVTASSPPPPSREYMSISVSGNCVGSPVTVTVRDEGGAPILGVTVRISLDGSSVDSGSTNGAGQMSFVLTEAGSYEVSAEESGYYDEERTFSVSVCVSCSDGIKNQDESDVDCGGSVCSKCVDGKTCSAGGDCSSSWCYNGSCRTSSCSDSIMGPGELGVDCGGPCPACISCSDGILNQDESDVDCGGMCQKCGSGLNCSTDSDCSSNWCKNGACTTPSCVDGTLNQDESDVDCGGSLCSQCSVGEDCSSDLDCSSGWCGNGSCRIPTCFDGARNQNESGVDCGGPCIACHCSNSIQDFGESGVDCGGECPSCACSNGVRDGNESDVDCGGSCSLCGNGRSCSADGDCASAWCFEGLCSSSSCGDGKRGPGEEGIDCGGACMPCHCFNEVMDEGEAGVDCGGGCSECRLIRIVTNETESGERTVLVFNSSSICANNLKDAGESDVDCGGHCPPCLLGKSCLNDSDCFSSWCYSGFCRKSSCSDGILGPGEKKVDCGGSCGDCPWIKVVDRYYLGENITIVIINPRDGLILKIKAPDGKTTEYKIGSVGKSTYWEITYMPNASGMYYLMLEGFDEEVYLRPEGYDEKYITVRRHDIIPLLEDVPEEIKSLFVPLLAASVAIFLWRRRRTKVVVDETTLSRFLSEGEALERLIGERGRLYVPSEEREEYSGYKVVVPVELGDGEKEAAEQLSDQYGVTSDIAKALFLAKKLRAKQIITSAELPDELRENYKGTRIRRPTLKTLNHRIKP